MQKADNLEITTVLRDFKTPEGLVKFDAVLSIPKENRIPALAKQDFKMTVGLIAAALTLAIEGMNLKRGMTPNQILDLAEAIIDTASEDNLALEDFMLFLQKLVRGEYKTTYEGMDMAKFMERFEIYREERWQNLNRIRMENHLRLKNMGDNTRNAKKDELSEHFASMGDRMSEMKKQIGKLKDENKNLKIDNF
jgi:hypothetical protein